MACGEDDGLLGDNQKFADFLTKEGISYALEIGPAHMSGISGTAILRKRFRNGFRWIRERRESTAET